MILDQSSARWGLQICKDMDFPKLSREYAARRGEPDAGTGVGL